MDGPEWTLIGRERSVDGEDDGSASGRGDARLGEAAAGVGDRTQVWSGLSGWRRETFSGDVWVEVEERRFRVESLWSLSVVDERRMRR